MGFASLVAQQPINPRTGRGTEQVGRRFRGSRAFGYRPSTEEHLIHTVVTQVVRLALSERVERLRGFWTFLILSPKEKCQPVYLTLSPFAP